MSRRPHYEGDPSLIRVMVRPQWIVALLLALAVAGGFAWLGQWQLEHAITTQNTEDHASETVRPLTDLTEAGAPVDDAAAGMVASITGDFVPGDFRVVEERKNGGSIGAWVTGHFASETGSLAVAIGWAPTPAEAERAAETLESEIVGGEEDLAIEGRYMPADAPVVPESEDDPGRLASMAPAQLVNVWEPFDGPAYAGYLVLHPAGAAGDSLSETVLRDAVLNDAGLDAIDSVPPLPVDAINWLNLFYAVEWVVFAGFAIFFWYRLTRDAWEKEHELKLAESQADAE